METLSLSNWEKKIPQNTTTKLTLILRSIFFNFRERQIEYCSLKKENKKVKYQSEFQYLHLSINLHSTLSFPHLI